MSPYHFRSRQWSRRARGKSMPRRKRPRGSIQNPRMGRNPTRPPNMRALAKGMRTQRDEGFLTHFSIRCRDVSCCPRSLALGVFDILARTRPDLISRLPRGPLDHVVIRPRRRYPWFSMLRAILEASNLLPPYACTASSVAEADHVWSPNGFGKKPETPYTNSRPTRANSKLKGAV